MDSTMRHALIWMRIVVGALEMVSIGRDRVAEGEAQSSIVPSVD